MTAPAPAPRKANTQFGQPLWFAGYASGDLLTSTPTLLKDRFIYVIEKRSNAPARLHMELHTSPDGELWAGPPDRRFRERDPQNRDIYPVMSPVPWTVEGNGNMHFFFASPTRLLKRAIAALESAVMTADFAADWVDFWQHPRPRGRFFNPPGHPPVLVVTDPLTIAKALHDDYAQALDDQLKYTMPPRKDKKEADKIRSRVAKYHLALLMNHYLLPGGKDPYNVRKELADRMGDNLRDYIDIFESKTRSLADQVDATAGRLIEYLQSPAWNLLAQLHTYCKEDTADWLEYAGHCFEWLGNSELGRTFLGKLHTKPPGWLAATGITGAPLPPEGAASAEEEELTFIAKKAASGISVFWAEVLPTAVALEKMAVTDALDRMDKVYRRIKHTHISFWHRWTARTEEFEFLWEEWSTKKRVDKHGLHREMSGLEEWIEEGEAKWPKESQGARTARTLININRVVQVINLALKLRDAGDPNKGDRFENWCEVVVGVLDTLEAFEETLKPKLEEVISERGAGALFKSMGAIAGFIHAGVMFRKLLDAKREGKRDLLQGYGVELVIFVAEGVGGVGEATLALFGGENALTLMLGVVASALCFVSFTGAIVAELYYEGKKKSPFQRFVNHSAFGLRDDPREEEIWASGRSFTKWKEEPSGLRRQRETLTMLFANFSVVVADRYSVNIRLGVTPPGMKLKVAFTHGDQESPYSPSHHPEIRAHVVIDPFAKPKQDPIESIDSAAVIWHVMVTKAEVDQSTTVHVACRPQGRHVEAATEYCYCDVQLVFETERPGQAEVAVPPEKPLRYTTMEGAGSQVSRTPKSSLPEPD